MSIEFESLEDKQASPADQLPDYDFEEDLISAKEWVFDLEEYVGKLKEDIILAQDWQKQLNNWILNAEITNATDYGNTP